VYLFKPARNSQLSRKFRAVWTGPYRITRRAGPLNYRIENQERKEQVIHMNRLKLANNPGIWERKVTRPPHDEIQDDRQSRMTAKRTYRLLDQLLCPYQEGRIDPQTREPDDDSCQSKHVVMKPL
jgi:hypothetical protein